MRSIILTLTFALCIVISKGQNSPSDLDRKKKMFTFLLEQKEFSQGQNSFAEYKDFFHEKLIYKNGECRMYFFSTNSAHSKVFIALSSKNGLKLLETRDMADDMDLIIPFLQPLSKSMNTNWFIDLLKEIQSCYKANKIKYY